MDQGSLRKKLLKQRELLGDLELEKLGTLISEQVIRSAWYREANVIHCFSGTLSKGEVPTYRILKDIISTGKTLVMPKMTGIDGIMEHHRVRHPDDLVSGKWGIMEPEINAPVSVDDIDLVLVPGLAADGSGNRIGFGKGYYDRFLSEIPGVKSLMLVPEAFVLEQVPVNDMDVPVKALATEKRTVVCR